MKARVVQSEAITGKRTLALVATLLLALLMGLGVAGTVTSEPAEAHRAGPYAKLNELRLKPDASMGPTPRSTAGGFRLISSIPPRVMFGTPPSSGTASVSGWGAAATSAAEGARLLYRQRLLPSTGHRYRPRGPLAEAWRTGAHSWSAAKRERFANIRLDVLAVEDNANASKGDREPEE